MAAIACAPPTRYTSSTPASAAAASVTAGTVPSGPGGTHSTIVVDTGDAGRHRSHEHARRIGGAPAGHVAAGPRSTGTTRSVRRMPSRSRVNPPARCAAWYAPISPCAYSSDSRTSDARPSRAAASADVRDPEVVEAAAVEALGEVAQCGVAPLTDVGDDLTDRVAPGPDHRAEGRVRTQGPPRRGGRTGPTSELRHGNRAAGFLRLRCPCARLGRWPSPDPGIRPRRALHGARAGRGPHAPRASPSPSTTTTPPTPRWPPTCSRPSARCRPRAASSTAPPPTWTRSDTPHRFGVTFRCPGEAESDAKTRPAVRP